MTDSKDIAAKVLVVDDDVINRMVLSTTLEAKGYWVETAEDGRLALEALHTRIFDVVLLDLLMPEMDGFDVLRALKADPKLQFIPVIVISAVDEMESVARCIEMGATDYLNKPFNVTLLDARLNASLAAKRLHDQEDKHRKQIEENNLLLEQRVQQQVRQITSAQMATIFALARLVEFRDTDTGHHIDRMREYSRLLAIRLSSIPQYQPVIDQIFVDNLYTAAPLHDIGKVGIPDQILLKPGKLTEEEYSVMRTHTVIGAAALRVVDKEFPGNHFIRIGIEIAESHHEKFNGKGYPYSIAGTSIPLPGRICALADVYDALAVQRSYKPAYSHEECIEIIKAERGQHFDPDVTDCFLALEKDFRQIREAMQDKEMRQ